MNPLAMPMCMADSQNSMALFNDATLKSFYANCMYNKAVYSSSHSNDHHSQANYVSHQLAQPLVTVYKCHLNVTATTCVEM